MRKYRISSLLVCCTVLFADRYINWYCKTDSTTAVQFVVLYDLALCTYHTDFTEPAPSSSMRAEVTQDSEIKL